MWLSPTPTILWQSVCSGSGLACGDGRGTVHGDARQHDGQENEEQPENPPPLLVVRPVRDVSIPADPVPLAWNSASARGVPAAPSRFRTSSAPLPQTPAAGTRPGVPRVAWMMGNSLAQLVSHGRGKLVEQIVRVSSAPGVPCTEDRAGVLLRNRASCCNERRPLSDPLDLSLSTSPGRCLK